METISVTVIYYMLVFFTSSMEINIMKFKDYNLCMEVVEHIHEIAGEEPDKGQCYDSYEYEEVLVLRDPPPVRPYQLGRIATNDNH